MFSIILKEIRGSYREKVNLFFFLAFPVLLIFFLGNLLTKMDVAEEGIGEIIVQYQIDTEDPYQQAAIRTFIDAAGAEGVLTFEEVSNLNEARELAARDDITAVVIFHGEPMEISVFEGTNSIKNRAVITILEGFIQNHKVINTLMEHNPMTVANLTVDNISGIEQKELGVHRTMIDYYAISMVAMISFMSMLVGAISFVGERQEKTMNRLIIAPQNRVGMFLQKVLGLVPQVIVQLSLIMFVSVFFFQAHYATNLRDNLYLYFFFLVVTLCMISIGVVIGIVIKVNPMSVIMPVLWLMMFFGGTYSKEVNIAGLSDAMPIYQIQQAAFDLAIFGRYDKVNIAIIICLVIMAVALVLGAYLFSRKEEER